MCFFFCSADIPAYLYVCLFVAWFIFKYLLSVNFCSHACRKKKLTLFCAQTACVKPLLNKNNTQHTFEYKALLFYGDKFCVKYFFLSSSFSHSFMWIKQDNSVFFFTYLCSSILCVTMKKWKIFTLQLWK
jgi:hypothetical protein